MRAVLLDLDDTLLDDRSATRTALDAFLSAHQASSAGRSREELLALWRSISARHWLRYEAGEVTFSEQRRCRVRDFLGRPLNDEEAEAAFLPYRHVYEQSWRLLPGVSEFLGRTRHVPKVIITNGDRDQQVRKVEATGLTDHVVGVVTPTDCGYWKPDPKIFLAAVAMLGVHPHECLMVGDDAHRDIEPARKLGMSCFLVEAGHEKQTLSHLFVDA